jgi:hypothetical protein
MEFQGGRHLVGKVGSFVFLFRQPCTPLSNLMRLLPGRTNKPTKLGPVRVLYRRPFSEQRRNLAVTERKGKEKGRGEILLDVERPFVERRRLKSGCNRAAFYRAKCTLGEGGRVFIFF